MFTRIQTSKVHTFNQQTLKCSKYNVWSNSGIKGGCLRKAASRYLKEMEKTGVLESQKVGRETLYIYKELIEILKR